MRILIDQGEIRGEIRVPPSKSYTIRSLMCAALAAGESHLINPLSADDTLAAVDVLKGVGVRIQEDADSWQVSGGSFVHPDRSLNCRESAATLRFMTAISSLVPGESHLIMGSSLAKRPIEPLIRALRKWGAKIEWSPSYGITVRGGKLDGGITEIPGDISSQFVSALLLVAPLTERRSIIRVTSPLESRSYVLMTLECLRSFGIQIETSDALNEFQSTSQAYQTSNYKVEGDWSSASYLIALGAAGGEIKLSGLNLSSLQSDRIMLDLVKEMGARLIVKGNCLIVKTGRLRAIKADLNECIDLLPTLAVLASLAEGTSEFTGIRRARLKESDRVLAISTNLQNAGIKVKIEDNRICITGGKTSSAVINPYGDHRIAMAFSIVGAAKGGILIENAECVSKTYPDFWTVLKNSGVIIHEQ